jgi:uncharacterized protein (DUF2141 family)
MTSIHGLSAQDGRVLRRGVAVLALAFALGIPTPTPATAEPSCEAARASVVVRVSGVRNSQGSIVAVLYGDRPEDFLKKGKRLARLHVPARPGRVEVCLPTPGPGVYAVAVFHDENGDLRLDRSWMGLPSEGYGLSNNPPPAWRWPQHSESAFKVAGDRVVLDVELRYGTDGAAASRPDAGSAPASGAVPAR